VSDRWPLVLPQSLPPETSITPVKNYVETEMDTGPPKRRRRFTAASKTIDVPDRFIFTTAQWEAFQKFHDDTLAGGTLPFAWRDPIPGLGDVLVRFSGEPPKATVRRAAHGRLVYRLVFQLEVLPGGP
jgi:hypothetical protein